MKNRLRVLRAEKEITQEQLAEAIGVTRQTISAVEKNEYWPNLEIAFKLSKYFQKPIEEIFEDDSE